MLHQSAIRVCSSSSSRIAPCASSSRLSPLLSRAGRRPSFARQSSTAVRASIIAIGDTLPAFELPTDASTPEKPVTIKSQDIVRDSGAVIFIYPKAATSGCTLQACGFNDNLDTFTKAGYKIYGLSADTPAEQAAWKKTHGFKYPLLCDTEFKVLPQLSGSAAGGKITRTHVVVAKGGKIVDFKLGVGSKDSVPEAIKFISGAVSV